MEKMRFEVEPLSGVGPARLGVHRDQLRAAMKAVPIPHLKDEDDRWETDAFFESAFQVFYGGDEPLVEFIELHEDDDIRTFIEGIDVFATPAGELVMRLDQKCRYDRGTDEFCYIFHDWELALWRPTVPESPDDEDGRHFATIGVGIRGYFDGRSS
jgi:hypothetical protein